MNTIRVWFSKRGTASFISHLDLQRVMHRALRKAKLPVWYSQGFNPHIYITFALPLPLGQESICEYMDYKTEEENPDLDRVYYGLKGILPQGIEVYNVSLAKNKSGKIAYARYIITFDESIKEEAKKAVQRFNRLKHAFCIKLGKQNGQRSVEKEIDLKDYVQTLKIFKTKENFCVEVLLPAGSVNINPALILGYFNDNFNLDCSGVNVCRTQVMLENFENFE
ncbi:MAG: TIGR03936 family radical SAM-associated protein [Oscillospiraceae bacterium]